MSEENKPEREWAEEQLAEKAQKTSEAISNVLDDLLKPLAVPPFIREDEREGYINSKRAEVEAYDGREELTAEQQTAVTEWLEANTVEILTAE